MQVKNFIFPFLIIVTSLTLCGYDYPKSRLEREMDEMGSVLGGEGIIFRPAKERSRATKALEGNVNRFMYKAAIEVLSFAPLQTADSSGGVIITEWYTLDDDPKTQYKVTAFIKDDIISPEGLEVIAHERNKIGGKWLDAHKKDNLSSALEDKILRKARELYLKEPKM